MSEYPDDIILEARNACRKMCSFSAPDEVAAFIAAKWETIAEAILSERNRNQWQPIAEFKPEHPMQQVLCGHSEKKWIRFGFRETVLKRWYYSGTNERSQWSQVEGDAPTHFMALPAPPIPHNPTEG